MDIRPLTAKLSVALQLAVDDLSALGAAGFRSVICNRPDGEDRAEGAHPAPLYRDSRLKGREWLAQPEMAN